MHPLQKIYFGPPGSGKSHLATAQANQLVQTPAADIFRTVFHPETTHGDFAAKLLPVSRDDGTVRYEVHAGPFVRAAARALANSGRPVVLIVDEVNRGQAAAIFGDFFQLLDRGEEGYSSYPITISKMVAQAFENEGYILEGGLLKLPPNLHLLGTMNTSDDSVYYMDAAFKRRWSWEFVGWNHGIGSPHSPLDAWLGKLNAFIAASAKNDPWLARSVDDKLVGRHFLSSAGGPLPKDKIRDNLMPYLWDNVFARNRDPLKQLLENATPATSGAAPAPAPSSAPANPNSTTAAQGKPLQRIYFGPPGSGKSHRATTDAEAIAAKDSNIDRTVFHPETTYGDFVAKLVPMSDPGGKVRYEIQPGPLVKAIARAWAFPGEHFVLIIDEINRGQAAAIFGDLFQLLDRDGQTGKSRYLVDPQDLIGQALVRELFCHGGPFNPKLMPEKAELPSNLSLLGTMNTSDESVYYMDAAFKRRWDWVFVKWDAGATRRLKFKNKTSDRDWSEFLIRLNSWIASNLHTAADDRLIGFWFCKLLTEEVSAERLQQMIDRQTSTGAEKKRPTPSEWMGSFIALFNSVQIHLEKSPSSTKSGANSLPLLIKAINEMNESFRLYDWSPLGKLMETETESWSWGEAGVNLPIVAASARNFCRDLVYGVNGECVRLGLSHHLWDNVFARDRSPISELLGKQDLTTYGHFVEHWDLFVDKIMERPTPNACAASELHSFGDFQRLSEAFIAKIDQWQPQTP